MKFKTRLHFIFDLFLKLHIHVSAGSQLSATTEIGRLTGTYTNTVLLIKSNQKTLI